MMEELWTPAKRLKMTAAEAVVDPPDADLGAGDCAADQRITLETLGLGSILPAALFQDRKILTDFPSKPEELPAHLPDDFVRDELKDVNPHATARDRHLCFRSEDHVYFWKGQQVARSVTQFTEPFCEERVIALMRSGKNWPRAGYFKPVVPQSLLNRLRNKPAVEELVAVLAQERPDEFRVCV